MLKICKPVNHSLTYTLIFPDSPYFPCLPVCGRMKSYADVQELDETYRPEETQEAQEDDGDSSLAGSRSRRKNLFAPVKQSRKHAIVVRLCSAASLAQSNAETNSKSDAAEFDDLKDSSGEDYSMSLLFLVLFVLCCL